MRKLRLSEDEGHNITQFAGEEPAAGPVKFTFFPFAKLTHKNTSSQRRLLSLSRLCENKILYFAMYIVHYFAQIF